MPPGRNTINKGLLRKSFLFAIVKTMIPEYFAIIGAVIASAGGFYYLYETIAGKSQPNRVTWLLWGLFPMIIFIAQRAQGVKGLSWLTFAAGLTPFLIVAASFLNKKAYWKTQPRDYILMAAAILGIVAWLVTDEPNLAILLTLVVDIFAGVPTVIKAIRYPQTESWIAYALSAVGFGIGVLAIQTYDFQNSAFVIYLFVMQTFLAIVCLRKPASQDEINV
jgi:hypothetical protein